jgi:hypothetical protein
MLYVILDREPIGHCTICEVPFYSNRDTVAHLRGSEHRLNMAAEMAARRQRNQRLAVFYDPEWGDPEIEAHMKRVGRRMRAERRWEVKPSERAGF